MASLSKTVEKGDLIPPKVAHRLGRRRVREIATIVTPDTLLRWHRQLVARKSTYAKPTSSRRGVLAGIRRQVVAHGRRESHVGVHADPRRAEERRPLCRAIHDCPDSKNISPVPERPTLWQVFLRAHWGAIAGADFFTTDVWTSQGLVTYYTVFVIDLASRRVQILGSTPFPNDAFMRQMVRTVTQGQKTVGCIRRRQRLGGLLKYYSRAA